MNVAAPGLTLVELEVILQRTDPSVLLVPPRILRRVIKQDRGLSGVGLQVPHYKSYVIGRDTLLRIADRGELGIPPGRELPETVILLPQPDLRRLRSRSVEAILLVSWRFLFHARVHATLAARNLDPAAVAGRVRRLGTTAFSEARSVLRQENFLLPASGAHADGEGGAIYEEFAAVYLELRYFARHLLSHYFPACSNFDAVDQLLAEDVNAEELFARTRPQGAPLPETIPEYRVQQVTRTGQSSIILPPDPSQARNAAGAAALGNDVRAARLHLRAGDRAAAVEAMRRLTDRLQKALHFAPTEAPQWRSSLEALLEPAAAGLWPAEARLLYDLQNTCVSQEKEIYALDLVEWAVTWGRRPVKRLLPHQPFVLTVKYLRRALGHLTVVQLPDDVRLRLRGLIAHALHHAERRLREHSRPLIRGALDDVDLRPTNFCEQVARDTVVEEMLDRVVERGFLTMSDLRDALARNRLKLPDMPNPARLLLGDKLIKANRKLAVALDGVYRRGEIYMRWLQRLSSVFFGTAIGRFLVLYLIVPVGLGGFAIKGPRLMWEEVQHLSNQAARLVGLGTKPPAEEHEEHPGEEHHSAHHGGLHFDQSDIMPIAAASLFFLCLIHLPPFRRLVGLLLHGIAAALWFILHDAPAVFLNLPAVRRILQSRGYLLLYQFAIKPAVWAALVGLILWWAGCEVQVILGGTGLVFVLAELLLNSRFGLRVEETCSDALVRGWYLLKVDIFPGSIQYVLAFFKWLLDGLDRLIYTVDEWLRFRPGDSRLSLAVKPVLGLIWFLLTYGFRFIITLFVEPTINPIKHFPVVTVAAKLLLPLIPFLLPVLRKGLTPIVGHALGHALAWTVIVLLPGIAGFLVWELKENWKLYRANQPDDLEPVTLGSHGETMLRLIRPGFHSGTLPKLYAKLRRYERRHQAARARKRREELHHVEEAVRHFAERGLVAMLDGSRGWRQKLFVGAVHAATNEIRIEIVRTGEAARSIPAHGPHGLEGTETSIMRRLTPESLEIAFEEQSGWLVASVCRPGWLQSLSREERLILADALAGFYKLAGVDLIGEQVAAVLPAGANWAMGDGRLIAWQEGNVVKYNPGDQAALPWQRVLFSRTPLRWADWVSAWQRDQDGKTHEPPLLPEVRLLP